MSTAATADPFIGTSIVNGQFHITKKIGTGGMGSVYRATQVAMNRAVAIKILHPKLANRKDLASRFSREARAMSQLTHPNTVKVFDYGELPRGEVGALSLYIVMEYLEGRNMNRAVKREGPLSVERAVGVLIQVCGALEEAHGMGIVHRDMKPENIFLCRQGQFSDYPKVLDFGLAKVTERQMRPGSIQLTQEGMVFGTPEFMSPEQAQGKTLDARSDIYSLAVIFYEAVTGKLPFDARTPMEHIQKHVMAAPIPLDERVPGYRFPAGLWPVVARGLAKAPEHRYQSAMEFAYALRPFAGSEAARVAGVFQMSAVPPSSTAPMVTHFAAEHAPAPPSSRSPQSAQPLPSSPQRVSSTLRLVVIAAVFLLLGATLAVFILLYITK